MKVMIMLIAVSLIVAVIFLISFLWAARSGQYEDDYTPSVRILFDDDLLPDETQRNQETGKKKNT